MRIYWREAESVVCEDHFIMFSDNLAKRTPRRSDPLELIRELAAATEFVSPAVVHDAYLRERILPFKMEFDAAGKEQWVKGATDLSRRLGIQPRTLYKLLKKNLDDSLKTLRINYVEVLVSGFQSAESFTFLAARKYLDSKSAPLTDQRLLAAC